MNKKLQIAINTAYEVSSSCSSVIVHVFVKPHEAPIVRVGGRQLVDLFHNGWREHSAFLAGEVIPRA